MEKIYEIQNTGKGVLNVLPENLLLIKDDSSIQTLVRLQDDFVDDVVAGAGGIAIGNLYHNAGEVRIRLV